jgi:hypothetical protein
MAIDQFIKNELNSNDIVLFMKGTPQFPMCGFSGQVVQILDHLGVAYKGLNVLGVAHHSPALCEGGVRWRLRHHSRDVPGRRAADAAEGQRGTGWGKGLHLTLVEQP